MQAATRTPAFCQTSETVFVRFLLIFFVGEFFIFLFCAKTTTVSPSGGICADSPFRSAQNRLRQRTKTNTPDRRTYLKMSGGSVE